ncbi:FmdB family zinc ribbon protein [Marinimicrobium sp. ARAG 43.8]|uniref:FmdB family zinc ribbon protein n=1 Tax=Marinimicrobium sp. ARAG 43.8 TaxID=3418719 RepID=UPI003CE691D5
MPIYEYQCQSCGHDMEALQKLSDEPLVDCPACGQASLKKKISAAGFRLKGGGWYETDFKKSNQKNLAGERKSAGSSGSEASKGGKGASGSGNAPA